MFKAINEGSLVLLVLRFVVLRFKNSKSGNKLFVAANSLLSKLPIPIKIEWL